MDSKHFPSPINTDVLQPHPAYRIQQQETRNQMQRYPRHAQQPEHEDPRAFYPYQPNEVKHRKRTTRAQLKVLEDIFTNDTKPAAPLRKDLAAKLDMTTRGVQVWFQNRRAKEKNLAKKLATAREKAGLPVDDSLLSDDESSPQLGDSPRSSAETEVAPETPPESLLSPNHVPDFASNSDGSISMLPQLHSPWQNDSSSASPVDGLDFDNDAHLLSLRRGSLPVNAYAQSSRGPSYGPPAVDPREVFSRRRSVDMKQLAFHPYAPLAMQKNSQLMRQGVRISSPVPSGRVQGPSHYQPRGSLPHRSSVPPEHGFPVRQHSMDGRGGFNYSSPMSSASSSPHSPFQPGRGGQRYQAHAMSTRTMSSPIPGPLPTVGFSFGAPASTEGDQAFDFHRPSVDSDFDSSSSASYSRFGSIASVAGSDTSAYYSDLGSCDVFDSSRRGSYASGAFPDLMSTLAVNGSSPQEQHEPAYSATGELLTAESDGHLGVGYTSPTSTISPGGSPHPQGSSPPGTIPISRSSELSGALHNQELPVHHSENNSPVGGQELPLTSSHDNLAFSYRDSSQTAEYPSHHFDAGYIHQQPYPGIDGPYTSDGTFSGGDASYSGADVPYNSNSDTFTFHSHMRSNSGGDVSVGGGEHFTYV